MRGAEGLSIAEKSKALARAGRIVVGLQGALDFEKGGDIARNLNDLYAYVTRRLFHVNANNDLDAEFICTHGNSNLSGQRLLHSGARIAYGSILLHTLCGSAAQFA